MKFKVIIDTCFWIALLDPKDFVNKSEAERIADLIEDQYLIIPFPTLYEFVNSRLSRRDTKVQFETIISRPNIIKLCDTEYKEIALENFFQKSNSYYSDVSLVDEVIKLILEDKLIGVDYIATFDLGLRNYAQSLGIHSV